MYLSDYYMVHKYPDGGAVVLNTLQGGITVWPEGVELPEDGCFKEGNLDETQQKLLAEAGILLGSKEEEERSIRNWTERRRKEALTEPIAHVIYLSYNCNLKCTYCCYSGLRDRKKVMESKDVDKILAMVEQVQSESGRDSRICLFGGEPLLRSSYPLVEHALKSIRKLAEREKREGRRCRVMIFTNGIELPYYKELLGEYKDCIEHVLVTLLGTKEMHNKLRVFGSGQGSFDRAAEGIESLLPTGIPVWAVTNVDKTNLGELQSNVELIKERGWDRCESFKGYYFGRIKYYDAGHPDALKESELLAEAVKSLRNNKEAQKWYNFGDMRLLKAIKNFYLFSTGQRDKAFHTIYGCGSGSLSQYSYDADGTLYTCSGAMGIKGYEIGAYYPVGKVEEAKARRWTDREVMKIEKCRGCRMAFLCGGGCAYAAREINGSEYLPCCNDSEQLMHIYLDGKRQGIEIGYRDLLRE